MKELATKVFSNIISQVISLMIMLFISFMLFSFIASSLKDKAPALEEHSFLVIDLSMNISDAPSVISPEEIIEEIIKGKSTKNINLIQMVNAINYAKEDDSISGIFMTGSLMPEQYGSGYSALKEVMKALDRFKKSKKPIIAYTVSPSLKDYYLMSCATEIFINPFGGLFLNGFASEVTFFGQALKKYGIGIQAPRSGKYKAAIEPFTSDKLSEPNRVQLQALLDNRWNNVAKKIAINRDIDQVSIIEKLNTAPYFKPEVAKEFGLVDSALYFDEVLDYLVSLGELDEKSKSFKQINLFDYVDLVPSISPNEESDNKIAIVYVDGVIVDGEGDNAANVGGDKIARKLRKIRKNGEYSAVILRVNSPGGSATASEIIQREVKLIKDKGIPVIISMGSMAASGGYWISAYSDIIFAEKETITGSIGVFGLMPNIQKLGNNLGITWDTIKTSKYADTLTIVRPKTDEEMKQVQEIIDEIYQAFITKVSEGRNIPMDQINEICQGRVWTGEKAKEIGLVDQIGGLEDAINHVVKTQDYKDDWQAVEFPKKKTPDELIQDFLAGPDASTVPLKENTFMKQIKQLEALLKQMSSMNDPQNVYALFPYSI